MKDQNSVNVRDLNTNHVPVTVKDEIQLRLRDDRIIHRHYTFAEIS